MLIIAVILDKSRLAGPGMSYLERKYAYLQVSDKASTLHMGDKVECWSEVMTLQGSSAMNSLGVGDPSLAFRRLRRKGPDEIAIVCEVGHARINRLVPSYLSPWLLMPPLYIFVTFGRKHFLN